MAETNTFTSASDPAAEAAAFEQAHRRPIGEVGDRFADAGARAIGDGMMMTSLGGAVWLRDDVQAHADGIQQAGAGAGTGGGGEVVLSPPPGSHAAAGPAWGAFASVADAGWPGADVGSVEVSATDDTGMDTGAPGPAAGASDQADAPADVATIPFGPIADVGRLAGSGGMGEGEIREPSGPAAPEPQVSRHGISLLTDTDTAADLVLETAVNGTPVGITARATDSDSFDSVTYSLSDDAGGRFAIDATTGVITVADGSLLDYETATSHTVTVLATSTDGSTSTESFTINLTDDTSEASVSAISDANAGANSVSESAADGTAVGITALATDADATDSVSYSLSDDAGGRFTIDAATGVITVADSSLLDYETAT
ncbi:MAG: cadherin repeat domain-containing protein, partial [Alphaproteobacteria bacterium]